MQVIPDTGARFGVAADKRRSVEQKLADPKLNISAGVRYLRFLMELFPNNLELVLAAYNAGEGAVQRYNNQIPPFPETRQYVSTVLEFYRLYQPDGASGGRVLRTGVAPEVVAAAQALEPVGLLLNAPRPHLIRLMPALNITAAEMDEGLALLKVLGWRQVPVKDAAPVWRLARKPRRIKPAPKPIPVDPNSPFAALAGLRS